MSDEQHSVTTQDKKSFFRSLFGGLFQQEPKNREDLVEVIRDSAENELIDTDTKR